MAYQKLREYSGSLYGAPSYSGIEYDWEVPDNTVVGSPGGVSSTQHYYTKGFYGQGSSTPDIYAGEGRMYPYGVLGSAYQYGQTAAVHQGIFDTPPDQMFTQNNSTPTIQEAYESIPTPDGHSATPVEKFTEAHGRVRVKVNPWILFLLFIIAYIAIDFISLGTQTYIQQRFHKGSTPSWKNYLLYGGIAAVILIAVAYITGTSLIEIENL
jgi:hypothetical protein